MDNFNRTSKINAVITTSNNLKALSAGVHFVQKVGKDLVIEFEDDMVQGLKSTLNDFHN